MPDRMRPTQSLAEITTQNLNSFFLSKTPHRPSPTMMEALSHLAQTLEDMAEGRCEPPSVYLSSLDPGVGKTQTIVHFVQALMDSPRHKHVGVLVCLSRLDEIRNMVGEMGLSRRDFAVMTSDPKLNVLGNEEPTYARVVFTTQQMIGRRCDDYGRFADVAAYHFNGHPRMVRIWDESILPGQTITLDTDSIAALIKPLRMKVSPALADDVKRVFMDVDGIADGTTYRMPELVLFHDEIHDLDSLTNGLLSESDDIIQTAVALWHMSGKSVSIKQDGIMGNTVLDYRNTMPDDLLPVVVLDASGRVRGTYREWEEHRGGLVRLKTAEKSYRNLTVNVWDTGGGKRAFLKHGDTLIDGIISTIKSKPGEEWLIVCHKPKRGPQGYDIEASVTDILDADGDMDLGRVHFLTWGNHHATNQYAHVQNVILAGTLFFRESMYEALGRLSADMDAEQGQYPAARRQRIKLGEHAHLVLQALCRASVRRCEGDVCAPCTAYVIASKKSGIRDLLPEIFPECHVGEWKPKTAMKPMKGRALQVFEFVRDWINEHEDGETLSFAEIRRELSFSDKKQFRHIRKREDLRDALSALNIVPYGTGRWPTGYKRLTGDDFGFTDQSTEAA